MGAFSLAFALLFGQHIVAADESYPCFRIATYNLNFGNRRGDQLLEAIQSSKADVLLLQETTRQSEQFLRKQLKESYPYFYAVGHKGRYAAERFAFVSKVSLRRVAYYPPATGYFGFYSAVGDFGKMPVRLINVHLSPIVVKRGAGITDVMVALNRAENQHVDEIKAICRRFDTASPTIVAGDFNSLSTMNAPIYLKKRGFTDSFAAVNKDADEQPTWQWPTRLLPVKLRIDYIFHTRHFRTIRSQIVQRQGSDHSLVVSELRVVGNKNAKNRGN